MQQQHQAARHPECVARMLDLLVLLPFCCPRQVSCGLTATCLLIQAGGGLDGWCSTGSTRLAWLRHLHVDMTSNSSRNKALQRLITTVRCQQVTQYDRACKQGQQCVIPLHFPMSMAAAQHNAAERCHCCCWWYCISSLVSSPLQHQPQLILHQSKALLKSPPFDNFIGRCTTM